MGLQYSKIDLKDDYVLKFKDKNEGQKPQISLALSSSSGTTPFESTDTPQSVLTPSNSIIIHQNSSSNIPKHSGSFSKLLMSKGNSKAGLLTPKSSRSSKSKLPPSGFSSNSNDYNLSFLSLSEKYDWLIKNGKFSSSIGLSDIELGKVIGNGLIGIVRICKLKKSNKYFVLKICRKDQVLKKKFIKHIFNEKLALYSFISIFCIRIFCTFQDKLNLYFALEYVPGGELLTRIETLKKLPYEHIKFYSLEIASALFHIHSFNFVYRDLKPENIAITEDGHIKLLDYGFTRQYKKNEKMYTTCGTPAYLSPELLNNLGYTEDVDWWAYGILLYEMSTGYTPFCNKDNYNSNYYEIFLKILNNKIKFPFYYDKVLKKFIKLLCSSDIKKRLSTDYNIKQYNDYFNNISWIDVDQGLLIPPFIPTLNKPGDDHYFHAEDYNNNNFNQCFMTEELRDPSKQLEFLNF